MSKLFMYGTSLEGIEQLMVMVPNFQPRRSAIVINNYFNCQGGDENCKLVWLMLMIVAGNVDTIIQIPKLMWIRKDIKTL